MELTSAGLLFAAKQTHVPAAKAETTLKLLFQEECTVAFIARYRKDATGGLDEVQIKALQDAYLEYQETEKRRAFCLEAIKGLGKLTPELEKNLLRAPTLQAIEDLYAPYKSKKKTKAQLAEEKGLKPLADLLLQTPKTLGELQDWIKTQFVDNQNDLESVEMALEGARDIICEVFGHDVEIKDKLRHEYWNKSQLIVEKKKDAENIKEFQKFKDFFEFKTPIQTLKNPKASHRFLAIRRGMNLKILKMEVEEQADYAQSILQEKYFPLHRPLGFRSELQKISQRAFQLFLHQSLDLEIKTELKKIADEAAIEVFGINLKNLLLSPYLGPKAVMGVDPGVVSGCKIVVISATGELLEDFVIYPHPPRQDILASQALLAKAIGKHHIEFIAIGNGTFGRETLDFFQKYIPPVEKGDIQATIISEAGASVYSASDIAREEFPEKDVTVRGAVSIARRFQDPLAELVKIEPKSIGVGQYQHDVNQTRLSSTLGSVVESCVNFVGVDLNTASAPLLSYISGIGPSTAKGIVSWRMKNGPFKNRKELLEIPRFSDKVFQQAAGFLRIYQGEQPLDATFVHPENYESIIKWVRSKNQSIKNLVGNPTLIKELEDDQQMVSQLGALTLQDIIKSLRAPSQDPRTAFKSVDFDKNLKTIKDLEVGKWYRGVINNITNFGAFVDIGLKESGLVHLSELADRYVTNPMEVVKVGQEVQARVLEVDMDRSRISLSMKSGEVRPKDAQPSPKTQSSPKSHRGDGFHKKNPGRDHSREHKNHPNQELKSNPFAALKGLKLK